MARSKKSLTCSSCFKPIGGKGKHFSVGTKSDIMHFHKNPHDCANTPDPESRTRATHGPDLTKEIETRGQPLWP